MAILSNQRKKPQAAGEPTVLMVSKKDGSVHPCLVSAVPYAFQNGYDLKDPKAYDMMKKGLNGEVDDGQIVKPESAEEPKAVSEAPASPSKAATTSWSETERLKRRREVVKPDES